MTRRRIRPCIIGRDGAGKSWFAATFPKPMLVCLFDAPDKAAEYLKRGIPGEIEADKYCYFQNVYSVKEPERIIIRIEYWGESNPSNPSAYGRFIQRSATLEKEIAEKGYQSTVMDSVTAFELAARFYSEYRINVGQEGGSSWPHYNFSMHACEQFVMTRWPNLLLTNAIVIAHYDEQKDETDAGLAVTRKMIAVPGKLPNRIGTQFAEVWRVYEDESGRHVQTCARPGRDNFACKTAVGFQDGVYPHYEALWSSVERLTPNVDNAIIKHDSEKSSVPQEIPGGTSGPDKSEPSGVSGEASTEHTSVA